MHVTFRSYIVPRLGTSSVRRLSSSSSSLETEAPSTTTQAAKDSRADMAKSQEEPLQREMKSTSKTQAELDEELRSKLSALAGDGGEAGIEYEDGKPAAMKRSVRENMFRYI